MWELAVSGVFLLWLFHPSVARVSMELLYCVKGPQSKYYLASHMTVRISAFACRHRIPSPHLCVPQERCDVGSFLARLPAAAIPLVFYVFLLPLFAFLMLRRWKRRNMLKAKVVVYRAGELLRRHDTSLLAGCNLACSVCVAACRVFLRWVSPVIVVVGGHVVCPQSFGGDHRVVACRRTPDGSNGRGAGCSCRHARAGPLPPPPKDEAPVRVCVSLPNVRCVVTLTSGCGAVQVPPSSWCIGCACRHIPRGSRAGRGWKPAGQHPWRVTCEHCVAWCRYQRRLWVVVGVRSGNAEACAALLPPLECQS